MSYLKIGRKGSISKMIDRIMPPILHSICIFQGLISKHKKERWQRSF